MDRKERFENYKKHLAEQKVTELAKNKGLIDAFIEFCNKYDVLLNHSDFDYQQGLGILCISKNIVLKINPNINLDKESLVDFENLTDEFEKRPFYEGALYAPNYVVYASHFFRRGFTKHSNFAPRFIDCFWKHDFKKNEVSIALDIHRVRVDIDGPILLEEDTWYGGKFKENIGDIKDGVTHLRPPQYLNSFEMDFFFASAFALDIYWYSYDNIKVFQALEFKQPNITVEIEGKAYFPVRYVHAEYDCANQTFRHFDGAIQFFNESEYYERRENNFNVKTKGKYQVKSKSKKLFKINGAIDVETWILFTCHFFTQNPLILEYVEGKEPEFLVQYLEALKKSKGIS